jgi:hypothetical protein
MAVASSVFNAILKLFGGFGLGGRCDTGEYAPRARRSEKMKGKCESKTRKNLNGLGGVVLVIPSSAQRKSSYLQAAGFRIGIVKGETGPHLTPGTPTRLQQHRGNSNSTNAANNDEIQSRDCQTNGGEVTTDSSCIEYAGNRPLEIAGSGH